MNFTVANLSGVPVNIDPCATTLNVPTAPLEGLSGAVQSAIDTVAEAQRNAGINLEVAQEQLAGRFIGSLNLLSTNLQSIMDMSKILAGTAKPSFQTAAAKALVAQIGQQVINMATQTIANQISGKLNEISAIQVDALQRTLAPVYAVLNTVNGIAGQAAADKALLDLVMGSQSCHTKAEALSEIYFRLKR
jgi:hypothetical protein